MEGIRSRVRDTDSQCPYCRDAFGEGDQVVACGGCATVYHQDCLRDELRGCASLGCEVRPELGKVFAWGERKELAGVLSRPGKGLTCCAEGASRADEIKVCTGCGSLLHVSCIERQGPCCPGQATVPLLGPKPGFDRLILNRLLVAWAVIGALAAFWLGALARRDPPSGAAIVAWVIGLLAFAAFGAVLLAARFADSRRRARSDKESNEG